MNRDPLPANDDAFYDPPEPKGTRKKWSAKKLWLFAIVLLVLAILGNFLRQPIADFIEFQMLTPEEQERIRNPGHQHVWLGIQQHTGKTVVEFVGLHHTEASL